MVGRPPSRLRLPSSRAGITRVGWRPGVVEVHQGDVDGLSGLGADPPGTGAAQGAGEGGRGFDEDAGQVALPGVQVQASRVLRAVGRVGAGH